MGRSEWHDDLEERYADLLLAQLYQRPKGQAGAETVCDDGEGLRDFGQLVEKICAAAARLAESGAGLSEADTGAAGRAELAVDCSCPLKAPDLALVVWRESVDICGHAQTHHTE